MKTAIIFLLCLTATTVMGSQVTKTLNKIQTSKFGKTLLATVELELKSGAADPRGQITSLLNEMNAEITAEQGDHDNQIGNKRNEYAANTERLTGRIGDLQSTIANAASDIELQNDIKDTTTGLLELKNGQIADLELAQRNDDELRAAEKATFEAFQVKYENLNEALHEVLGWIQDRQDEVANGGAFLQLPSVSFVQVSKKIDATSKKHPVIAPIFAMIKNRLKIYFDEEGNFVKGGVAGENHHTINVNPTETATGEFGTIETLIGNLIDTFAGYLSSSVDAEREAIAAYTDRSVDRATTILAYQGEVSAFEATIVGAIAQIAIDESIIADSTTELNAAEEELAYVETDYQNAEKYYFERTTERNEEIAIIGQISDILSNSLSHLTGYLEDRIGATDDEGLVRAEEITV